ncbi:MAG: hypothetical protein HY864_00860 [Chloroflexi bacterium]|nr:hypothetical protein [Chloroflexota bacterium]
MGRRYILSVKEIYARRAFNWEWHYKNRGAAKMYCVEDMVRVGAVIMREVPAPEMRIDGSLFEGMAHLLGTKAALGKTFPTGDRVMMCAWYWSETAWMDFVRQFQNLPDVTEDYCFLYDEVLDVARLVPASTMPGRGRPIRVQIPKVARVK